MSDDNQKPDPVLLDTADHIATLTINQPERRNSMRRKVLARFKERIDEVRADPEVRVLVIRGTGKYFCTGADFAGSGGILDSDLPGAAGMRENVRKIYDAFMCVRDVEVPVIACVNGHAIGGGLGLALVCDIRLAATDAKLGANFARLGLAPGMATSYILPRLVGMPRAAELLFTGRIVKGDEAARLGLVNEAYPRDDLDDEVNALASEIATCAPLALRLAKRALYGAADFNPDRALDFEAFAQAACIGTNDFQEGISALLQKRTPEFKGR